jgi:hypothetical protein
MAEEKKEHIWQEKELHKGHSRQKWKSHRKEMEWMRRKKSKS